MGDNTTPRNLKKDLVRGLHSMPKECRIHIGAGVQKATDS